MWKTVSDKKPEPKEKNKNDEDFLLLWINKFHPLIYHFPIGFWDEHENNRPLIVKILTTGAPKIGNIFYNLSEELKADKYVFMLSIETADWGIFKHVSEDLKKDIDVIEKVRTMCFEAREYLDKSIPFEDLSDTCLFL